MLLYLYFCLTSISILRLSLDWFLTVVCLCVSGPGRECEDSGESGLSGRVQSGGDGTHHAPHAPRADAAPQTRSERRVFCGSLHPRAHGRPERAPRPDLGPSAAGALKLMHSS